MTENPASGPGGDLPSIRRSPGFGSARANDWIWRWRSAQASIRSRDSIPELETRVAALATETHREPQAMLVEPVGKALERDEQREGKLAAQRSAIDEVRFFRRGEADFDDPTAYTVRTWDADQADRYLTLLDDHCQRLADTPMLGRVRSHPSSACCVPNRCLRACSQQFGTR
jgi:plasmid stabilization system protein ParE